MDRRDFLTATTSTVLGTSAALADTPLITSGAMHPQMAHGIQSGDTAGQGWGINEAWAGRRWPGCWTG